MRFFTIEGAEPLADIEDMMNRRVRDEDIDEDLRLLCILIDRIKSQEPWLDRSTYQPPKGCRGA